MMQRGNWPKWIVVLLLALTVAAGAMARTGAWFDEVIISEENNSGAAVARVDAGDADVFIFGITDATLFGQVRANPNLSYVRNVGSTSEITLNPVGPTFPGTGKLNPFSVPRIREAMNWLIDRDYVANEIMGGLAIPKYTSLSAPFADAKVRYADIYEEIVDTYAPDRAKATAIFDEEMPKLGAVKTDGKWMYNGEVVNLICLIRVEDERRQMGDYVAGLLEDLGFETTRLYRTGAESSPIWMNSDPALGQWNLYTGGWVTTAIARDQGTNFAYYYTKIGRSDPLWQAYENQPAYMAVAEKLWNNDFNSMDERRDLFEEAMWSAMKESQRIWVVDRTAFSPFIPEFKVAADVAGGIYGSQAWGYTAHFVDAAGARKEGGTLRVLVNSMLSNPWNPIAGSNWVYDMFPIRGTGEYAYVRDTRDGLVWPLHFERAEVFALEGLPIGSDPRHTWCTLTFVPEIQVPADTWYDFDATTQKWITVGEAFPEGTTAKVKSVIYFPDDLYDTPLHDGSKVSLADIVMAMIIQFDRPKPESKIYDESAVPAYKSYMTIHKGYRIVQKSPLIIEYYSDSFQLDAEITSYAFGIAGGSVVFPYYAQGPGFWHTLTLGILAEEEGLLTFSNTKADRLGTTWASYIAGPSIEILAAKLAECKASAYRPYLPTMEEFLPASEAVVRWTRLESFYKTYGHFWVASGPYMLERAYPIEKVVMLKRFADYPLPSDTFTFLIDPLP
ncbi:MAG: ABC transporter substrate-binding protein [Candidatus Bipolaricaulia bacterium]